MITSVAVAHAQKEMGLLYLQHWLLLWVFPATEPLIERLGKVRPKERFNNNLNNEDLQV